MAVPARSGRTFTRGTPRSAIVSTILLGLLVDGFSHCQTLSSPSVGTVGVGSLGCRPSR